MTKKKIPQAAENALREAELMRICGATLDLVHRVLCGRGAFPGPSEDISNAFHRIRLYQLDLETRAMRNVFMFGLVDQKTRDKAEFLAFKKFFDFDIDGGTRNEIMSFLAPAFNPPSSYGVKEHREFYEELQDAFNPQRKKDTKGDPK